METIKNKINMKLIPGQKIAFIPTRAHINPGKGRKLIYSLWYVNRLAWKKIFIGTEYGIQIHWYVDLSSWAKITAISASMK